MSNGSRVDFHATLEKAAGNTNVYFQPPSTVKMKYPAIVYERGNIQNSFADDLVYVQAISYKVTVMDKNPDSEIVKRISQLPTARFVQHFTADNLNHDVFIIFY